MEIWVISLFLIGLGLAGFGAIWTLVISFGESIFWGISYLFLPFIGALLFISIKWNKRSVKMSLFSQLVGIIFMGISAILAILQNWSFQNIIAHWTPKEKSETSVTQVRLNYPKQTALSVEVSPETQPPYEPSISLRSYGSRSQFKRYMEVGYHAFDLEDYHTALINFEQALKEQPDNTYAKKAVENTQQRIQQGSYTQLMNAGYQAFDRQDYAIALEYFQTALEHRPGDSYALKAIDNTQRKLNP
ncbi:MULTISPECIES: hypothetical protein [unclassified Roseofilum]|uniref:hypothetical protein n=1 Tax=unclassified Roseofilum TaxID=2620099 RepID=UPI001B27CEBE|nr:MULTISPECIES: hypothetical protein [unclassified Roseofilum]MBP0009894.1 hypothetical protein [Roseofilum sp. Belize Diploria]MBP0015038.1 hypothetical protein [Roseofilum sp. SID3]MBP0034769.1 hypothetical protein [Roseofilum sp. Belize BBD 4]MBP0037999.1 hypothetical protein [Roseofilum sp. SID1]MBP0041127.1 hypothetical protein [Roseofilum sp. SBFL]